MSTKLLVFISFILALLVTFAHCEEIVVNTGTLPNDAVIYTAGEIPITVIIPNNKANNLMSIAFDSSRRWVNYNLGMRDYKYNVTLLSKPFYGPYSAKEEHIQNVGSFKRFNYRPLATTRSYYFGGSFPYIKDMLNRRSINCTTYISIKPSGYTTHSIQVIPDEYYPIVFRIEPIYNNYTKVVEEECRDKSRTECLDVPCVSAKGVEFDESYFYTINKVSASSSIVKHNSTIIEHSFMLLIMFICLVFTINI